MMEISFLNHCLWFMKLALPQIKPFLSNVPIIYPLKTLKNERFSGVFRGYKMVTFGKKWVKGRAHYLQIYELLIKKKRLGGGSSNSKIKTLK